MRYRIDVHSLGYEDYSTIVEASSLFHAKRHERDAKIKWCELNAIDLDNNFEMPFTRTQKAITQ